MLIAKLMLNGARTLAYELSITVNADDVCSHNRIYTSWPQQTTQQCTNVASATLYTSAADNYKCTN